MDFRTMKISFCKKSGNNVVEADDKQQIIDILYKKYSINFKTNRAMILNAKSLSFLRLNPHLISIKTTGSNYYLFLTRINDICCAFFIDRKVKQGYTLPRIISVNLSFNESIFNDTLLDGELIKDKHNNWMFLISDMSVYKGKKLTENIIGRFDKLISTLETEFREDPIKDICPIRIKRLFDYSEYSYLITQYIPKLEYNIRGLYFNTLNTKHCNQLFIYKDHNSNNGTNNTRAVQVQRKANTNMEEIRTFRINTTMQPEIYDLFHSKNNEEVRFDMAHISGLRISKLIRVLFESGDAVYVNCKFNKKFNKWEPFENGLKEDIYEENK